MKLRSTTPLLLAATASPALAHGGRVTPGTWIHTWNWEPGIIAGLFVAAALYVTGLRWLRRSTGVRRKMWREAFCFWTGWLLLALALVSPLHPLSRELFAAHMTQHELLMVAAAPLLVLGRPGVVWLWALPAGQARSVGGAVRRLRLGRARWLLHPFTAWAAHAMALWIWHVPRFFEATIDNDLVHTFQHACFLGTAVWFWDTVFYGPQRRAGYGMAVFNLFTTALHTGALGALITFATAPWYPQYAAAAVAWGTTATEDQQLGGMIMWIPAGLSYIVAALVLFAGWMRESERHAGSLVTLNPQSRCAPSS